MKLFDIDNLRCPKCNSLTPPIRVVDYIVTCPECGHKEVV